MKFEPGVEEMVADAEAALLIGEDERASKLYEAAAKTSAAYDWRQAAHLFLLGSQYRSSNFVEADYLAQQAQLLFEDHADATAVAEVSLRRATLADETDHIDEARRAYSVSIGYSARYLSERALASIAEGKDIWAEPEIEACIERITYCRSRLVRNIG